MCVCVPWPGLVGCCVALCASQSFSLCVSLVSTSPTPLLPLPAFAVGVAVGVRLAGWVCYMHPSHAGCCPRCGNAHSSLRSAVVGDDTGCFFLLFVSGREGATSYVVAPTLLPSSHVSGCVVCVGAVLAATRPLCPCFRVFQCAYACVMLRRSHIAM